MLNRRKFIRDSSKWGALISCVRPWQLPAENLGPQSKSILPPSLLAAKLFVLEGQGVALARDKGPDSVYAQLQPPVLEGLRLWTGSTQTSQDISLGFGGHGAAATADGRFVVVFEKWGQHSAILDLKTGARTEFTPVKGAEFYGHGSISADGLHILVAESELESGASMISVRDLTSGKLVDVWRYDGIGIHDLTVIKSENVILAPFSGRQMTWVLDKPLPEAVAKKIGDSFLAVIDGKSGKIIERQPAPNPDLSLTHIFTDPLDDKKFYIGTTPRTLPNFYGAGGVNIANSASLAPIFGTLGKGLSIATLPPEIRDMMKLEIINVAVDERNDIVAFTASLAGYALLHRRSTGDFVKAVKFEMPISGIVAVPVSDSLLVTSLGNRSSWLVSTRQKDVGTITKTDIELGRGSHLYSLT